MVKKYIILAYSNDKTFDIPRQLVEINGEPLLKRTIRLLKENGIENIILTGKDKRYKELGVELYSSEKNDYDYINHTGYWLNAFDFELMNEPVCFIWGDVYFSEEAIKTIVETDTDSTMFFCSYNNDNEYYIKHHDEPLAYKVVDTDLFKEHITRVKEMKDKGLCCREPIVWEVYRSIHGQDINTHEMTTDFVAINDISCDIDSAKDAEEIEYQIRRKNMIKVEVIEKFSYAKYEEIKDTLKRKSTDEKGMLFVGDTFECDKETVEYLTGGNPLGKVVVKVVEVKPEAPKVEALTDNEEPEVFVGYTQVIEQPKKKTTRKKK